jgi:SH3-like domain-containing protein
VVGEDFSGPDRVWKNVRDPDGTTGWVAADFLQAVP